MLRRQIGFTLTEVLIILVIVGVTATVGMKEISPAIEEAQVTADAYQGRIITEAVDLFYYSKGRYPQSIDELQAVKLLGTVKSAQRINGQSATVDDQTLGNPVFHIVLARGSVEVFNVRTGEPVFSSE